jgi:hypothetical protein
MFPGVDPGGAQQRLLPERIPMRFFGTAVACHVLAWGALAVVADELPTFAGGPGPVLASVHVLTLGVLVMTAMGASLQMLPVALGRPAPSPTACNVVYLLYLPGAALLVYGFAVIGETAIVAGAALTFTAVALYVATVARVLWGAEGSRPVVLHLWAGFAALAFAAALALTLSLDYTRGFLPDHMRVALVHVTLGGYGFMGMFVLGFSQVLVPMFTITMVLGRRLAEGSLWTAVAGLGLAVVGLLADQPVVVGAALLAGLVAAGLHVRLMTETVRTRMRKRLGPEFVFLRASWVLLPASLLLGVGLLFDVLPDTGPALFGFILLYGWLLTLLLGVLQRIIPFLASMHTARTGGSPVAPSKLTAETPLKVHLWCHFAGLPVVGAGIALDVAELVRAGAAVGAVGAGAYGWFAVTILLRTHTHLSTPAAAEKGKIR